MTRATSDSKFTALLVACAGILYILSLKAYYVGFFKDDAFYLLGADALLEGSYANLAAPGRPALTQYLPGFSLLLAPLRLICAHEELLSLACAGFLLCAAAGIPAAFGQTLPKRAAWAAAFACALSPLWVSLSGAVLADGAYTAWTLAVMAFARRHWENTEWKSWAAAGFACGFAFWLRPTGLALAAALTAALLIAGRRREAACCLSAAAVLIVAWPLRNWMASGAPFSYASELSAGGPAAVLMGLPASAGGHLLELYSRALFRWPWPSSAAAAATAALGSALTLAGARAWLKASPSPWRRFPAAYAAMYFVGICFWDKPSARYILPLMPLAAAWLFAALARRSGQAASTACALSLACSLWVDAGIARASLSGGTPLTDEPKVYSWMRLRLPPGSLVGSELDAQTFLRTGFQALRPPRVSSGSELEAWGLAHGLTHLLLLPDGGLLRTRRGSSHDAAAPESLAALADASPRFLPAYSDSSGARLYSLK